MTTKETTIPEKKIPIGFDENEFGIKIINIFFNRIN